MNVGCSSEEEKVLYDWNEKDFDLPDLSSWGAFDSPIIDNTAHLSFENFYKHIATAVNVMKHHDLNESKKQLSYARCLMVDKVETYKSGMLMRQNITTFCDHLRILNDVEDYVNNSECTEILYHNLSSVDYIKGSLYSRSSTSDGIRATILRLLKSDKSKWNVAVASCVKQQSALYLQGNPSEVDQESYCRLLSIACRRQNPIIRATLQLHSAKLLENRGNIKLAMPTLRIVIESLKNDAVCDQAFGDHRKFLISTALSFQELWKTKHCFLSLLQKEY